MTSSTERVSAAYTAIRAAQRPEIWITLLPEADALAAAAEVDRRVDGGETLPLAGLVGAVKDNIDVAGVSTTAGCPAFAYIPSDDATAVARLVDAGLVLIGKTNLDQFATGLVGTRSPYGEVASAADATRVAGGSSSGSAVAVALGVVDIALGTDTAGSGRVPAAFNGIVGTKPTRGLIPASGVVPACPSIDCVSIFTRTVALGASALAICSGTDGIDPLARSWPADAALAAPPKLNVAVATPGSIGVIDPEAMRSFTAAVAILEKLGVEVRPIDITPLLDAGTLLYGGGIVAERHASVGAFVDTHRDLVDPIVGGIIAAAGSVTASAMARDAATVASATLAARASLAGCDALMVPTVGEHPTFDEVHADPVGVNVRLGRFTTFCNLLDMAAISLPSKGGDERIAHFGVTLVAPAFADQVLAQIAAQIVGEDAPPAPLRGSLIVVVGAHLAGQPLNTQLTSRGARFVTSTTTAPTYRLFALPTNPPKPGLVKVAEGGSSIEVEVWELPSSRFGEFVAEIPPPLGVGRVELADGSTATGFILAVSSVPEGLEEITAFGGWRNYLADQAAGAARRAQ